MAKKWPYLSWEFSYNFPMIFLRSAPWSLFLGTRSSECSRSLESAPAPWNAWGRSLESVPLRPALGVPFLEPEEIIGNIGKS